MQADTRRACRLQPRAGVERYAFCTCPGTVLALPNSPPSTSRPRGATTRPTPAILRRRGQWGFAGVR